MKTLFKICAPVLLLALAACGSEPEEPQVQMSGPDTNVTEQDPAELEEGVDKPEPFAFFMEDGSVTHFEGEGNEFAQLEVRTEHLDDEHVALYENNGGTTVLHVYRVGDDRIELVKEEPEFYEEYTPTSEELLQLEPISVYLEFPLEEGNEIDGRTLVETGAALETPYRTFEDVYVFENQEDDGAMNRSYFAEGFGEVKREFVMEGEGNAFEVTSTLESVE